MPIVSLYAEGTATIEVGRYGMTLEDAKDAFLATCEKFNLTPQIGGDEGEIEFEFTPKSCGCGWGDLHERLGKLLAEVAIIADLHGDPPNSYQLSLIQDVPPGEYVQTGTYND